MKARRLTRTANWWSPPPARREDGLFQAFVASSGGLSDEERKTWPERLAPLAVESRFVRKDSRGVAFRMLRPEVVVELSVGELVAEDAAVIERLREDKDASPESVRVSSSEAQILALFEAAIVENVKKGWEEVG